MRLLLLDCDLDVDYRNTSRMLLRELSPVGCEVDSFRACDGRLPDTDEGYDGIIISGSAANVGDDDGWIAALLAFLRAAAERGTPLLGICFGHQAIAVALGGAVEPLGETEFGYPAVHLEDDPLFAGLPRNARLFQHHDYRVSSLPEGARTIARNGRCTQGFVLPGRTVYGLQFHPEILPAFARDIARRHGKDPVILDEEIATGTGTAFAGGAIIRRFCALVAQRGERDSGG